MTRWSRLSCGLALAVAAIGCGKRPQPPSLPELAAQINATLPAAWKDKFSLTPGTIDAKGQRYTLLVPKGWVASPAHEGTIVPADNTIIDASPVFGFSNEVAVSSYCGGECGPGRDWRKVSDDQFFAQFKDTRVRSTILTDEQQPSGRLMIVQREPEKGSDVKVTPQDKARLVLRAWWEKNGTSYHLCQVSLSDISYELAPAMAAACMTATVAPIPGAAAK